MTPGRRSGDTGEEKQRTGGIGLADLEARTMARQRQQAGTIAPPVSSSFDDIDMATHVEIRTQPDRPVYTAVWRPKFRNPAMFDLQPP